MWQVPLFDIAFSHQELEAVQKVLQSGWLTMGPVTQEFEGAFADFLGVKHAIAVSSCTAALHLAAVALGIGPGDEVICPALTFVAGPNSIMYTGAKPVFAEITGPNALTISPTDIERKITPRTKAIQVMHYGGYPCDMDQIVGIAQAHNLAIIEDVAHAPGAVYKDKLLGTIGTIGCFSFFSNKNMTTGEGGMVTTNDDALADRIRLMRSHGMTTLTLDRHRGRAHSYDVIELGYNYRIDELRSALGLVQLAKLEQNNRRRSEIVAQYIERLQNVPFIQIPFANFEHRSAYHIFPVLLNKPIDRYWLMKQMKSAGIQTSVHYPPAHLFSVYNRKFGYNRGDLPVTESVADRELTLPLYPTMEIEQIDFVCNTLRELLSRWL